MSYQDCIQKGLPVLNPLPLIFFSDSKHIKNADDLPPKQKTYINNNYKSLLILNNGFVSESMLTGIFIIGQFL